MLGRTRLVARLAHRANTDWWVLRSWLLNRFHETPLVEGGNVRVGSFFSELEKNGEKVEELPKDPGEFIVSALGYIIYLFLILLTPKGI